MADLTGPNPDEIQGVDARDAAITAAPVLMGARGSTATPSAVGTDGDAVDLWGSPFGALNVILRDTSGAAVASGTQYTEDGALGSTGTGTLVVGRRDDALSTLTPVEGDAVGLRVGDKGALWVQISDGSGNQITGEAIGGSQHLHVLAEIPSDDTSSGTLAASNSQSYQLTQGRSSISWQILDSGGAWTGTLYFEKSLDNTNWVPMYVQSGTDVVGSISGSAQNGVYYGALGSVAYVRIRRGAGTGTVAFTVYRSAGVKAVGLISDLPTGDNTIGRLKITDGTYVASVRNLANPSLNVAIVDGSGAQITSFGGGTQYAVDDPLGATPTGTLAVATRDDALSTLTPIEGDAVALRANSRGALWVAHDGGLQVQGDIAHDAVDSGNPIKIGGRASSTLPTAVAVGDRVNAWYGLSGEQVVALGATFANPADAVSNTGIMTLARTASGTAAYLGVLPFLYNRQTSSWDRASTGTVDNAGGEGMAAAALMVFNGSTYDRVRYLSADATSAQGLLSTQPALFNGSTYDRARSGGVTGMQGVSGDIAHDAVDAGYPIKIGGRAQSGGLTVADGDRVDAQFNLYGHLGVYASATVTPADGATNSAVHLLRQNGGQAPLQVFASVYNGTTWDRVRSGGVTGMQGIGGATAADSAIAAYPVTIGGRASAATPSAISTDGDVVNAWFTTRGALNTRLVDANGDPLSVGGGTQYAEDTALGATPTGTLAIGVGSTATPTAVSADGDAVSLWATLNGALNVVLRDASGTAVPAGYQYAEDAALGSTPTGTLMMARRDDALAALTPVEGDAIGLRVGDRGALWAQIADASGNQITSFRSTQYVEDATLGSVGSATGTLSMARATLAKPSVTADGDATAIWANLNGAQIVSQAPHTGLVGDPWSLASKTAQYTTTQTSAVLVAGGASEKIVVTKVQVQAGGTTAGALQLYFGTGAYSRGTNRAIFDGEFAPSATMKPGVVMDGPFIAGTNGDDLMVTTSAAINPLTITVWYYVLT